MSALPPEEIAYEKAHSKDNRGPKPIGITTMFLALGILAVRKLRFSDNSFQGE